ncbi:hypothetical protein [Aurantiacibacter marinus]|uniref:Porin domain-containing protein n=1 Tax=Aurantiacibacter marinus TaxID=874156 RepID=A0A0H0XRS1_9SPHN|nr:hypothetical protein [Aurantiacibacter marinus]KLI64652.1 hypothetical protein AAV99_03620 [Aurantiacibacter marinus]
MARRNNSVAGKVALAASATLLAVALPSSVFAIGLLSADGTEQAGGQFAFTPAAADPDIAELVAQGTGGQARMMRFTPAGVSASRAERSVTVAVRIDQRTAQSLSDATAGISAPRDNAGATGGLRVAPTRYNLGLARGYGNFAQSPAQLSSRMTIPTVTRSPQISRSLSEANIPDLSSFAPRTRARGDESRFAARVEMDDNTSVAANNRRDSVGDQMLDVRGSYRLTNNLDITAGVRYEQDRDIVPLPEIDQQDSQAVYVGTQFRF